MFPKCRCDQCLAEEEDEKEDERADDGQNMDWVIDTKSGLGYAIGGDGHLSKTTDGFVTLLPIKRKDTRI